MLVRLCDGWGHACALAGLPAPQDPASRDAVLRAKFDELFHAFDRGQVGLAALAEQAGALGGQTPAQFIAALDVYTRGPFPGAMELIDDLHAAGHLTACLSNTNVRHWAILTDVSNPHGPVLARLKYRFASHLVGIRKPDTGIYEHLERETGVDGSRILFFDDMAVNVEAARLRGWAAHRVDVCENPIPAIRARLRDAGLA